MCIPAPERNALFSSQFGSSNLRSGTLLIWVSGECAGQQCWACVSECSHMLIAQSRRGKRGLWGECDQSTLYVREDSIMKPIKAQAKYI
jgi:hypothetical protein